MIFGLTGGGDSSEGAAVEAGCRRENHGLLDASALMAVFAGQFDRGFVGFRAGIAEKNAVGTAVVHQPAGELLLFRNPIEIRDVLKASELFAQSLIHRSVAVAQCAGRDTSDRIEVSATLCVFDPAALPFGQSQRETAVGVHHSGWMGAGGLEPPRPVAG